MSSVNTVIISGNLGAPPEDRRTQAGKLVCTFRLANHRWDPKTDEEVTEWHTVVAFERQAEVCIKYLTKGSSVLVEGRIAVRQWDEADGKKHTRHEIVATRVIFLGSGRAAREVPAEAPPAPKPREAKGFSVDSIPF